MPKKTLIETAFPLAQTSAASLHEKNMRHGHISTLHLWPARRPLAASRAAIAAALLPDPGNDVERALLTRRLGGRLMPKKKTRSEEDGKVQASKLVGDGGILWWGQQASPDVGWFRDAIRRANGDRAPRVLDPFAGGGAIPMEAMRLGCEVTAADINPVAWFVLRCTLAYPQALGADRRPLPLWARRDPGFMAAFLKAHGTRPAAVKDGIRLAAEEAEAQPSLIADEAPPWLRADLSWHIRAWGGRVMERVRGELGTRYPTYAGWCSLDDTLVEAREPRMLHPGAPVSAEVRRLNDEADARELDNPSAPRWVAKPTVAYLWARTVTCKHCRADVPLLKTTWLSRKSGKRIRLLVQSRGRGRGVDFAIQDHVPVEGGTPQARKEADKRLGRGTMSTTGVRCPCCDGLMKMEHLRYEASGGRTGAVMTAVVCDGPKRREYRLPTEAERLAAQIPSEVLDEIFGDIPHGRPCEPIPPERPSPNTRGASGLTRYGITDWGKLFTDRQLLVLAHLCRAVRELGAELEGEGYPEVWRKAIVSYLALANDRCADYGSVLCSWANSGEFIRGTFVRFVLSIVWDYAEVNPLSAFTGGHASAVEWVAKAVAHACEALKDAPAPRVLNVNATEVEGAFDAVVTDPPYYDAIPYSDLMDFFHVWLRRAVWGMDKEHERAFREPLGPKWNRERGEGELVDQPGRFGADVSASRKAYEEGMARVFKRCHAALEGGGPLVLVFANKQPLAWGALVASLIRSGFMVNASWPIKTERGARTNAISTASLSSSVWLVCRRRPPGRPSYSGPVIEQMRANITTQMHRFWDVGITGPDFVWAATGPALEAYSRFPAVFRETSATGERELMPVEEFLNEVRRIVVEFAVGRVLRMERSADGEQASLDEITTYYVLHRDSFGMGDAPIGACILYAISCSLLVDDLSDRFDLLAKTGGGSAAAPAAPEAEDAPEDEEADDAEEEASEPVEEAEGKGSRVRLRRWDQRKRKAHELEGHGGKPAPLIDRVHLVMRLWKEGDLTKVNAYLERSGAARDPLFGHLVQALIELARREGAKEEVSLLESVSNHLQARSGVERLAQASLGL